MTRKIIMTCAVLLAVAAPAVAQDQTGNLITMTGSAIVQGTPDRAWVTVGIEARNPEPGPAREQVAVGMQHIQQRLKSLGIPEDALRTSSFNINQDWEFNQNRRIMRGYVVSNQVVVRVDDIAKVAGVIDGSIAAGANMLHGVRWDMKNRAALERQALKEAFDNARERADVIARAAGRKLGPVYAVQESRFGEVRPLQMRAQMAGAGAVAESLSVINPGVMDIQSVVTVSFVIYP